MLELARNHIQGFNIFSPARVISSAGVLGIRRGLWEGKRAYPGHQNSPKALYSMVFGPKSLNI